MKYLLKVAKAIAAMKVMYLTSMNRSARVNCGHLATKSLLNCLNACLRVPAYLGPLPSKSRLDPAKRVSLLLLDKDILQHEEEAEPSESGFEAF